MQIKLKNIYFLSLLFLMVLSSCKDDEILMDQNEQNPDWNANEEIYSLSFTMTLDKMGGVGTRAEGFTNNMEDEENYIDPEKIRVLFFNKDDKFLFESKSRWIKQLTATDHNSWFISVPLYTFGNGYDWNWEEIRSILTTQDFKIAILANRPDREWNMGINMKSEPSRSVVPSGWFGNEGPYWTPENSIATEGVDLENVKDVFDLHHCQYDPIYDGKNYQNSGNDDNGAEISDPINRHFYDFVAEYGNGDFNGETRVDVPFMGATSSWVDWGINDNAKHPSWEYRYSRLPSKDHPIPMYGIQRFSNIPPGEWEKGTTYDLRDLADYKPISLLRSVVKIELWIPTSITPGFVTIFYPNIYARCEPMNVWTPTDELWLNEEKEFDMIWKHGPVGSKNNTTYGTGTNETSKKNYQERLKWWYGIWQEKGWKYWNHDKTAQVSMDDSDEYPQIFNACIQRNTAIICNNYDIVSLNNVNYRQYYAYVGERNLNHPSKLENILSTSSSDLSQIYWLFQSGNYYYSFTITDYNNDSNSGQAKKAYYKANTTNSATVKPTNGNTGMTDYMTNVHNEANNTPMPYPLMRNHVYRLIINGTAPSTRADNVNIDELQVTSEIDKSRTIRFWEPRNSNITKK